MEAERATPAEYYESYPEEDYENLAEPRLYAWNNQSTVLSQPRTLQGVYAGWGKRLLDLALSVPLLLIAAPVILLAAFAVLLTSRGPVFYKARRVGKDGREFNMWKLRTMVPDAEAKILQWKESDSRLAEEYLQHFKIKHDPRITKVGKLLRRSSIDELPQLWNVIRGDMSLVGPRPIVAEELRHYGRNQTDLLAVRPGITGPWQLDGRTSITYPERTWYELRYCRTFSLASDLSVLAKTLLTPIRFNGQ